MKLFPQLAELVPERLFFLALGLAVIGVEGLFGLRQSSMMAIQNVAEQTVGLGQRLALVAQRIEYLRTPTGAFLHRGNGVQSRVSKGG
ncbi:hypothetical protein D3C78_1448930 [compost metagenome]